MSQTNYLRSDARMSRHWVAAYLLLMSAPFAAFAQNAPDPVEDLRRILATSSDLDDAVLLKDRRVKINNAIEQLRTISQLRRAYLLPGWWSATKKADAEKADPDPKKPEKKPIDRRDPDQIKIGDKLIGALQAAKQQAISAPDDPTQRVNLLAVAMLLAELADSEHPTERKRDKLVRDKRLTDLAIELSNHSNIAVKQTALHALGKMTPPPAEALKVLQARILDKNEPGPRRVAAYAMIDMVRNGNSLSREDQIQTIHGVIRTATLGFNDANTEESLRGYCLLAIRDSATSLDEWVRNADVDNKGDPRDELQAALTAGEAASPSLIESLHNGPANIRVASMDALIALAQVRVQLLPRIAAKKGLTDPLGGPAVFDARVKGVAAVLFNTGNDVRERRGAMAFLDLLAAHAEPGLPAITKAMTDPDNLVRFAAARAIRHYPVQADKKTAAVADETIAALGKLLLDGDPAINSAAAESLDVLGQRAGVAIESLSKAITYGDAENRVAALKLVSDLGDATALRAYPAVIDSLGHDDPRVTRQAAETLGQFGTIANNEDKKAKTNPTLKRLLDSFREAALPALGKSLRDRDAETRLSVSEAILIIGTK